MCSPVALKVILVCFERQLDSQWYWLSLQVKEMALRKVGGLALWDFLDFIVRTRIPIFVLLRPFIQCKVTVAFAPARSLTEGNSLYCPAENRGMALLEELGVYIGSDFSEVSRPVNPSKLNHRAFS